MSSSAWVFSEIVINASFFRSHYDMKAMRCVFISFKYFRFIVMQII